MNTYRLVIQVQVIWILRLGVVKCEISSYRAGFVDWDYSLENIQLELQWVSCYLMHYYVIPGVF
jgi:hypothetical protein